MSFEFKKKLPVPKEIKELYPVSAGLAARKRTRPAGDRCYYRKIR